MYTTPLCQGKVTSVLLSTALKSKSFPSISDLVLAWIVYLPYQITFQNIWWTASNSSRTDGISDHSCKSLPSNGTVFFCPSQGILTSIVPDLKLYWVLFKVNGRVKLGNLIGPCILSLTAFESWASLPGLYSRKKYGGAGVSLLH